MRLTRAVLLSLILSASVAFGQTGEPVVPASSGDPDGFVITADSVEGGEGPTGRWIRLENNVTITREGSSLVGDRGFYREGERVAVIYGGVHGTDRGARVTCDTLKYFRDLDLIVLIGNASYADTAGVLCADRMEMYRREGIAVSRGSCVATDDDGKSRLTGGRLIYDFERHEIRTSREPLLTTYDDDGEIEAKLSAEVIELYPDSDIVRALGDAVVRREDVTGRARVIVISGADDSVVLVGEPSVQQESDRLSGELIRLSGSNGDISRVIATGQARVDYTVDHEDEIEFGHVSGDTLTMFFTDGEAVLTTVRGHAESEHIIGSLGERNLIAAPAADILFSEGKIARATFRRGATGSYWLLSEDGGSGAEGQETDGSEVEGVVAVADSTTLGEVKYSGDRIDYYVGRNRVVLTGAAHAEYERTVLDADIVTFDPENDVLSAEGEPDLMEKSDRLVGASLLYDMEQKTGVVSDGITVFEDGLYYGERIVREGDGTLRARGGVYTTCSAPEPHYRIVSHKMKVYLNDKVIAKPVILYIGEIPVFALPFYVFPIRKERHSGFLIPQIEVGLSESKGRFVKNFGYYWAPSDYWDLSGWADYYEQTKWILHLESRYRIRYSMSGSVRSSFMQELSQDKRRWDLRIDHRQEMGRHWTAGISGDFRSDEFYASDANQSIQESVNRSLHSQLWVRGRWSNLSTGITLDRREQLDDETISELLPKIEVTASQQALVETETGDSGLKEWLGRVSYSWKARAVNDRDRSVDGVDVNQGIGISGGLRGSSKIMGWLNITPRFNAQQNWYDRDKEGNRFPSRFSYDASVSARTTIYGTFFPEMGPLQGIRHIIEPSLSYTWKPELSQYFDADGSDCFYSFSGFGATPRSKKSIGVSLVNKIQLKLHEGGKTRRMDDLLRFTMSSSYDFKRDDLRWADVTSRVDLKPWRASSVRLNMRHDAYDWEMERADLTMTLNLTGQRPVMPDESWEDRIAGGTGSPADELRRELAQRSMSDRVGGRPWDASMTFRYSRGSDPADATYWLDLKLALSLTANWRVNYKIHYDLSGDEVASQEYAVYRDMHCWEARFVSRYYNGEWECYFRINIKALPEIQGEAGSKHLNRTVR
jgi:lipopolysaccharide export system protein LptA